MGRKDYSPVHRILKLKCEVINLPVYEKGRARCIVPAKDFCLSRESGNPEVNNKIKR